MLKISRVSRFVLAMGIIGVPLALVVAQPGNDATTCYTPFSFGVTQSCTNGCAVWSECPTSILCTATPTGGGIGSVNLVWYACPSFTNGTGTCGSCTNGTPSPPTKSVLINVQTCPPPCEVFQGE